MAKVSVIIPIYGVENFIGHCADTLMQQTLQDVEYIFVNDCTKDESISILKEVLSRYDHRKDQIRIVEHEKNKGLPTARNTGLAIATGEYILHCDGDDFVEPTMLEELYNSAKEQDADIVWCDFFESYKDKEIYKSEPDYLVAEDATKSMLSGSMKYNVWNKLVRRSLYKTSKVTFPEGRSMGEDLTIIKLFAVADRVCHISQALYHYVRWNEGAMTQKWTQDKIQALKGNVSDVAEYMHKWKGNMYDSELAYLKLWLKFQFLLTDGSNGMYHQWSMWFPDSNLYIKTLPGANSRLKLLMSMAAKEQWWFVWIHYWVIVKWYYGIVYNR
ncbi:MAG: glycosyltransferase family 2 protein [Bacteroidales bacterium]|nr:glycosyltransferase family 2 protein [Candidatus Cryptobacteroides onthequi]